MEFLYFYLILGAGFSFGFILAIQNRVRSDEGFRYIFTDFVESLGYEINDSLYAKMFLAGVFVWPVMLYILITNWKI